MQRIILSILAVSSFNLGANAQNVTIPDANFKAYLVGNPSINTNADTEIQVSEASAFTGVISCTSQSISDLTGIEAFTSLTTLNCQSNSLTALDLSQNVALVNLFCKWNSLTSLNITGCTQLVQISCNYNQITTLDVSTNTAITSLECNLNQLSSLDVSNHTALSILDCGSNSLTHLDLSNNVNLTELTAGFNSLTSLDLSTNTLLTKLTCFYNQIVSLDVSNNTDITQFVADNNALTSLNLSNGNNTNISLFQVHVNPNLTCIQVDDATYSTTNWTNVDATASYSENCGLGIDDFNYKQLNVYPNPASNQLSISMEGQLEFLEIFDLLGSKVQREETASFSIEGLPSGIYYLKGKTSQGLFSSKFVKE